MNIKKTYLGMKMTLGVFWAYSPRHFLIVILIVPAIRRLLLFIFVSGLAFAPSLLLAGTAGCGTTV